MSKHTPGPWDFSFESINDEWAIVTTQGGAVVANVNADYRLDANARLIAAAPEMYEALKAFMSFYDKAMEGASPGFDEARGCDHVLFGMNDARLMIGHFWDARDAIAKAEGRT